MAHALSRSLHSLIVCGALVALALPAAHASSRDSETKEPRPAMLPIAEVVADADGDSVPDRLGERVTVRGTVTLGVGVLDHNRLQIFIQDDTGGIKIYAPQVTVRVAAGDTLVVTGEVSQYHGLEELVAPEIQVVGRGFPIAPLRTSPGDVNSERCSGMLVLVQGTVRNVRRNRGGELFDVRDANGTATVFLSNYRPTALPAEGFQPGDKIQVVGVVSQYDMEPPYASFYQVVPRDADDILVIQRGWPKKEVLAVIAVIAVFVLASLLWVMTLRRRVREKTEELRQRVDSLEAIREIASSVNSKHEIDELLKLIVDSSRQAIEGADAGAILLYEPDTDCLRIRSVSGYVNPAAIVNTEWPRGDGAPGKVFESGEGIIRNEEPPVDEFDTSTPAGQRLLEATGGHRPVSTLCVPVFCREGKIGTLTIDSFTPGRQFNRADFELLETLGHEVGTAVRTAQLIQDLQATYRDLGKARDQLARADKLAAVGELVSGVAHEMNNPLTSILGLAELLICGGFDEKVRSDVETIHHEAVRCSKIVKNLLSFAREQEPEKAPVNINELLESTLELRRYQLSVNDVRVTTDLAELPVMQADPGQLRQVFMNILNNAAQAMEASPVKELRIATAVRDHTIRITFSDTGPGILEEYRSKIFDPFFTTKEVGKGTGLGLSVSYGIIHKHGGEISVESERWSGTTFTIELPIESPGPREDESPPAEAAPASREPKRILVVDDEGVVLDVFAQMFDMDGHTVDLYSDATEALSRARETEYDVIIVDMKLPGLDGPGFYRRLAELDPRSAERVVFITGDIVDPSVQEFLSSVDNPCVTKPFHVDQIRALVGRVPPRQSASASEQ